MIFALLECPRPKTGVEYTTFRKLAYLEKMIASLLLAAPSMRSRLEERIAYFERTAVGGASAASLVLLRGLRALLFYYIPAVFKLGVLVRNCTWAGRGRGSGAEALMAMRQALLLLLALLGPTKARSTKYCKTISVALLLWQPWYDRLPGCAFAEESCEAMLSRVAQRCREHPHLFEYDDVFDLYLTTPSARFGLKTRAGGLRAELVQIISSRLRRTIDRAESMPFAVVVGGVRVKKGEAKSKFAEACPDVELPTVPRQVNTIQLQWLLLAALKGLARNHPKSCLSSHGGRLLSGSFFVHVGLQVPEFR